MLSRLDTIPARDGRTDIFRQQNQIPSLCTTWRG